MSRFRLSDQLKALQRRHDELKHQAAHLVRARRDLLLRHGLLTAWCDSLTFLQLTISAQPCEDAEDGHFEQLLQREVDLLQQLTSCNNGALECSSGLAALVETEVETIAPCTDPMSYLHSTVSKLPTPEALTMTAETLAGLMARSVLDISVKLHQLECVPPWERPKRMKQIAAVWDRYMHHFVSMIMLGRQDILEAAHALNLETMQPDAAAGSHQASQAAALVPLLGLSEQQQELIAVGMRLYFDLEHGIHQERQLLQAQMLALDPGELPDTVVSQDADSPCNSSERLTDLSSRQVQLQKQAELLNKLKMLLHKEYMLRMVGMGYLVGRLSYEQLSTLAVTCWPYAMRVLFLGAEIMQQREKLVQQRLQLVD